MIQTVNRPTVVMGASHQPSRDQRSDVSNAERRRYRSTRAIARVRDARAEIFWRRVLGTDDVRRTVLGHRTWFPCGPNVPALLAAARAPRFHPKGDRHALDWQSGQVSRATRSRLLRSRFSRWRIGLSMQLAPVQVGVLPTDEGGTLIILVSCLLHTFRGISGSREGIGVPAGELRCISFPSRSPCNPLASLTRAVRNASGSRRISAFRSRRSSPARGATADTPGANLPTNAWPLRTGRTSSSLVRSSA